MAQYEEESTLDKVKKGAGVALTVSVATFLGVAAYNEVKTAASGPKGSDVEQLADAVSKLF